MDPSFFRTTSSSPSSTILVNPSAIASALLTVAALLRACKRFWRVSVFWMSHSVSPIVTFLIVTFTSRAPHINYIMPAFSCIKSIQMA